MGIAVGQLMSSMAQWTRRLWSSSGAGRSQACCDPLCTYLHELQDKKVSLVTNPSINELVRYDRRTSRKRALEGVEVPRVSKSDVDDCVSRGRETKSSVFALHYIQMKRF